jgi:hypothetical protein
MTAGLRKISLRQWVLVLVFIPVAALFFQKRLAAQLGALPTAARIGVERGLLEERREQLQTLQDQVGSREGQVAELRRLAAPFWSIDDRNAARQKNILQSEVTRVLTKANIRGVDYQIVNPRRLDIAEKSQVYEVEVTVNMTASMREIARVLAEIDRSTQALTWSQCNLAPLNLRDTSKVRLTGTLRARVLSPDAAALLRGGSEVAP